MQTFVINVDDNISLHPLKEGDEVDIFTCLDENRKDLRTYLSFVDQTLELSDSLKYVDYVLNDNSASIFTIRNKAMKFIGLIGFQSTDFSNRCAEVGYWMSPHFQGKGIMTKSMKALMKFGFSQRGLNRIEVRVAVVNKKSTAVCERLGLVKEGIERKRLLLYDTYYDVQVFSILSSECNF